jgi:ABC-type transport system involved in cytochrome bd biosynthesis fused ATPase/permease subunit
MKKSRIIFYCVFAAYQVIVFLFTLYVRAKQQDYLSLYAMLSYVSVFIYGAFLGVVLILIDLIWTWRANKLSATKEEELVLENNTLKAKIYDLQETSKEASRIGPPAAK